MGRSKKDLENLVSQLEAENIVLASKIPLIPSKELIIKDQSPAELLAKINGFEAQVAQLKYLKEQVVKNGESKIALRSFNQQLEGVNIILRSINAKVL